MARWRPKCVCPELVGQSSRRILRNPSRIPVVCLNSYKSPYTGSGYINRPTTALSSRRCDLNDFGLLRQPIRNCSALEPHRFSSSWQGPPTAHCRFSTSAINMAGQKIDGIAIARSIRERLHAQIQETQKSNPRYKPSLKIVQVGDRADSSTYRT